jgi:di/tricarboxylate transporter
MYTIPATVAISFALVLPTSTPVNAIIFTTQKIDIPTMVKFGLVMTLIGMLLVVLGWLAIGQFTFRGKFLKNFQIGNFLLIFFNLGT